MKKRLLIAAFLVLLPCLAYGFGFGHSMINRTVTAVSNILQLETGDNFLLETGDNLTLE